MLDNLLAPFDVRSYRSSTLTRPLRAVPRQTRPSIWMAMAPNDDNSDVPQPPSGYLSRATSNLILAGDLAALRSELQSLRDENARLVEELSAERRASLRLQRELEDSIAQLQDELSRLRADDAAAAAEQAAPRHSWIARKEPARATADTVRPPPATVKR